MGHRTNFPKYLGPLLLILAPAILGICIIKIGDKHQNSKPIFVLIGLLSKTAIIWISISLILFNINIIKNQSNTVFWNLMIIPNVILWFDWLAFGSFYFSSPSAIWLKKYKPEKNLPREQLINKNWIWKSDSLNPINAQIAIKKDNYALLELSSIKSKKDYFFVISWWQKGGIRHDPFVSKKLRGLAIPWLTRKFGYSNSEFDIKMLDGIEFLDEYL